MIRWILLGSVFQVVMVLAGHWLPDIAQLFGPLGVTISLVVGLLWAREYARAYGHAAWGGAVVGGACALIGIGISLGLGDVGPVILAFGTVTSAVAGTLGGLVGLRFGARAAEGA